MDATVPEIGRRRVALRAPRLRGRLAALRRAWVWLAGGALGTALLVGAGGALVANLWLVTVIATGTAALWLYGRAADAQIAALEWYALTLEDRLRAQGEAVP